MIEFKPILISKIIFSSKGLNTSKRYQIIYIDMENAIQAFLKQQQTPIPIPKL